MIRLFYKIGEVNMDNKKKFILSVLVALLILAIGVAYSFFTYESGTKSDIVTGQIYMNYEETSTISLTGVFPETKAQALARQDENGVFEFTITGRNTSDKPVYYEIDLLDGGVITGKDASSTKILPEHVMIYLERDGEPLIDGMTYQDFDTRRIWVETVPANQDTNIEHKYTLRMWIDESVTISDTNRYADYTTSEWNSAYASLKVRVTGDFNVKTSPYDYMARFGDVVDLFTGEEGSFWPENIETEKANITSINFIKMDEDIMSGRYNTATIKADVTDTTKSDVGSVLAWLEVDATDNTKYTMYVASDGTIYFPSNTSGMFFAFENLTNITFTNVSTQYVTNMQFMFTTASLNLTNLDLGSFDTSSVTNMKGMFCYAAGLTQLDLSSFDTNKVTTMSAMFMLCSSLTNLDLNNFDTSNVTDMSLMFSSFETEMSFTNLDVSNFDTSNVTTMYSMFANCSRLTSLDVSNFDTSNVTTMSEMFAYCSSLTRLDVSNFDTNNVTDMSYMFQKCSSLTSIDISAFDTRNVKEVHFMFAYCSGLITIYSNNDLKTNIISSSNDMFRDCTSLVGAVPFDSTKTSISMANPDTGYFTRKEA